MNIKELPIIRKDGRGTIYDCDKLKFISRKKGTISANHEHSVQEILYLIIGEVELTVGDETKTVQAPIKITLPPGTYHKLVALTDIAILEDREGE